MRNNHAKLLAKNAVLLCPICEWTTTWDIGSKVSLTSELKKHLRQDHTEEDWKSSGWQNTCDCSVCENDILPK